MGKKIGIILMAISFVLWIFILGAPWLSMSTALKASMVVIFIILGEIFFWGGTALLGKDIVKKYKQYLNPIIWLRKK